MRTVAEVIGLMTDVEIVAQQDRWRPARSISASN